jgi:hypothetical protein
LSDEALADMAEARRLGTPNPDVYRIFDHHPALRRSFTEHWRVMVDDGLADRPAPDRACGRLRDEEKLAASTPGGRRTCSTSARRRCCGCAQD